MCNEFTIDKSRKCYAVMTKDLTAISFESTRFEECIKYCFKQYVIAERNPVLCGFSFNIQFRPFHKRLCLSGCEKNIFRLHWSITKIFRHKTGMVVFWHAPLKGLTINPDGVLR